MTHTVVTIARGFGSGGRIVGQRLAEALGIAFYDRELLRLASDESGIHERLFGQADERVRTGLIKKTGVYKGELLPPDSSDFVSDDNLFNYQAKIIRELADTCSCVIVGRCADYILRGRPDVTRVFIFAARDCCVQTVKELYGMTRREAERAVESTDKRRSEYYKYYTGQAWDNARNYDLCLNSGDLGFDKCVQIIQGYLSVRQK